jgi:hypothetical protein
MKGRLSFFGALLAMTIGFMSCMDPSVQILPAEAETTISVQNVPASVETITIDVEGPEMASASWAVGRRDAVAVLRVPVGPDRVFIGKAGPFSTTVTADVPPSGLYLVLRFTSAIEAAFDSGTQGWTATVDAPALTWQNGVVSAVDGNQGDYWYFSADGRFLGDRSAFYGSTLSYEIDISSGTVQSQADIIIDGDTQSLYYGFPDLPVPGQWTAFSVSIDVAQDWRIAAPGRTALPQTPATEQQIRTVLSDVKAFNIRGEYDVNADDSASLDNVVWRVP